MAAPYPPTPSPTYIPLCPPPYPALPPQTTFQEMGFSVYGGDDAPYIWVGFPGASLPVTLCRNTARSHGHRVPDALGGSGGCLESQDPLGHLLTRPLSCV